MRNTFSILFIYVFIFSFSNCSTSTISTAKENNTLEVQLSNLVKVARVTGKTLPDEKLPNPNNTDEKYDVAGTDLGIFWKMEGNKTGIFFGDTNGKGFIPYKNKGGGNGSNWRSNVLAFSEDNDLNDGLTINDWAVDQSGKAREVIAGAKANPEVYQTSIPTSAIHANNADYVHYMNIYEWAAPKGRWLTNFSSVYASYDGGENWQRKQALTFHKDSRFSQIAYAKKDGFIFMLGTLSGRGSPAYLARVKEKNIEALQTYEYWNGSDYKWVTNNEASATPVIPAPVGEASLLYHEKLKTWILMYIYDFNHDTNPVTNKHAIVYRNADQLNGTWSDIKVLTTAEEYPGLYSPYIYPNNDNGDEIFFTMSLWGPYNVYLMKADIGYSP